MDTNFKTSIVIKNSPTDVFQTITKKIPEWWSKDYVGSASKENDEFTVRFGNTFKTMRIEKVEPNKTVVWRCIDQHLEMPEGMAQLHNKKEWVGNKLIWSIQEDGSGTELQFVHEGLTPEVECWGVCEQGWDQTFLSLKNLLTSGKGNPFAMLDEEHLEKARTAAKLS